MTSKGVLPGGVAGGSCAAARGVSAAGSAFAGVRWRLDAMVQRRRRSSTMPGSMYSRACGAAASASVGAHAPAPNAEPAAPVVKVEVHLEASADGKGAAAAGPVGPGGGVKLEPRADGKGAAAAGPVGTGGGAPAAGSGGSAAEAMMAEVEVSLAHAAGTGAPGKAFKWDAAAMEAAAWAAVEELARGDQEFELDMHAWPLGLDGVEPAVQPEVGAGGGGAAAPGPGPVGMVGVVKLEVHLEPSADGKGAAAAGPVGTGGGAPAAGRGGSGAEPMMVEVEVALAHAAVTGAPEQARKQARKWDGAAMEAAAWAAVEELARGDQEFELDRHEWPLGLDGVEPAVQPEVGAGGGGAAAPGPGPVGMVGGAAAAASGSAVAPAVVAKGVVAQTRPAGKGAAEAVPKRRRVVRGAGVVAAAAAAAAPAPAAVGAAAAAAAAGPVQARLTKAQVAAAVRALDREYRVALNGLRGQARLNALLVVRAAFEDPGDVALAALAWRAMVPAEELGPLGAALAQHAQRLPWDDQVCVLLSVAARYWFDAAAADAASPAPPVPLLVAGSPEVGALAAVVTARTRASPPAGGAAGPPMVYPLPYSAAAAVGVLNAGGARRVVAAVRIVNARAWNRPQWRRRNIAQRHGWVLAGGSAFNLGRPAAQQHPLTVGDQDLYLVGMQTLDAAQTMLSMLLFELSLELTFFSARVTDRAITLEVQERGNGSAPRLRVQLCLRVHVSAYDVVNSFDICLCMAVLVLAGDAKDDEFLMHERFVRGWCRGLEAFIAPGDEGATTAARVTKYEAKGVTLLRAGGAAGAAAAGGAGDSGGGSSLSVWQDLQALQRELQPDHHLAHMGGAVMAQWWGGPLGLWRAPWQA